MIRPFIILRLVLIGITGISGRHAVADSTGSVPEKWEAARAAYDEGRWADAAALYQEILAGGQYAQPLFFNLGNAWFKQDRLGLAILNYRRASYLEPRDPDTNANLQFALKQARVEAPALTFLDRVLRAGSLSEWMVVQLFSYWLLAALIGVFVCRPPQRAVLGRLIVLAALPLAIAIAGIVHWNGLQNHPEVVVLEPGQEALYAPMEGATVHFPAPEGAILRKLDEAEGWLKVSNGQQQGWIRASASQPVYPLTRG